MADYFQFTANSDYLRQKLTPQEIGKITQWQNGQYDFSFHTMHEAGWPLYIIEPGKRGVRSRPKINLKDKTAVQAHILEGTFDNKQVGVEAKAVAVANWTVFQKLAQMFYEGVNANTGPVKSATVLQYKCKSPQCAGRIVTLEYDGPASATNVPSGMAMKALGVCKLCRHKNWEYVGARALNIGEKPDVPLAQTTPVASV